MQKFENLAQLVFYMKDNLKNANFLNYKFNENWQKISVEDFCNQVFALSLALKKIGVKKGDRIANYSYQNPKWLIVDLASILAGAITVPIFNNINEDNLFYEIEDADCKFIFTDKPEITQKIWQKFPNIKIIGNSFKSENIFELDELIKNEIPNLSQNLPSIQNLASEILPTDIATIVYTSGSTSKPKGVEILHQSLVSQIHDSDNFFKLNQSQIVLSYLPLAHIFERMVMMYYLSIGMSIYFVDDIKKLGEFLREVRPNLMTSVPRALEKVYAKINSSINDANFIKKLIGKTALKKALVKDPNQNNSLVDKFFDKIIYSKFRQALGGNMEMIICGGNALSAELERFYWNIGVKIYCGYGMTECSPVLATNAPNQQKFTTVGKAFPAVSLKLASDGELLAKGINVMKQYHNQPQKTAECFEDGWFKTGDLAEIDENGFVKIVGRKKELFKTSNGKFVHPVLIEQKLVQELGFLIGAIVIAENRNFVSALLFIDFDLINNIKKKLNYIGNNEDFTNSTILNNYCEKIINNINLKFDQWEQIKKFKVISQQISIENGEITPSMKLKRNILEKRFENEINNFYL
ncbi:MAG: AMP-dependent synthetase/ligase [Rickettsiales bacterium]